MACVPGSFMWKFAKDKIPKKNVCSRQRHRLITFSYTSLKLCYTCANCKTLACQKISLMELVKTKKDLKKNHRKQKNLWPCTFPLCIFLSPPCAPLAVSFNVAITHCSQQVALCVSPVQILSCSAHKHFTSCLITSCAQRNKCSFQHTNSNDH